MSTPVSEQPQRVSYLGPRGTFTEQAAVLYAPQGELLPHGSITASAEAVANGAVDAAIVPFENSLGGAVGETHDLIIHHLNLSICNELVIPIEQCLIVPPETDLSRIELVLSHPQALHQCQRYLQRRFPDAETQATLSTSEAVERILSYQPAGASGRGVAAIAPRRAAEIHGAQIAETGIEDDHRNATRFVVLAHSDHQPTGDDKTTIIFTTANRPGALLQALQRFADAGINLTRIESRPAREQLGAYLFIVDCDGHRLDQGMSVVLNQLSTELERLRVVGSYPRAPRP